MMDWLNSNAAVIQAVGSVLAIFIAIVVVVLSHWLGVRRSEKAIRQEKARTLETVASIMIHAMNLIETAKKNICDRGGSSIGGYGLEVHDPHKFENAAQALCEIPIAQLPDYEVVRPVIEMRLLVPRAKELIEQICEYYENNEGDWEEGARDFAKLHHTANQHTETISDAVKRVRDGD
jgi:hypothetical protein